MDVTKKRAKRADYRFYEKRHGDQITCATAKERVYIVSAFINWKRKRPGSLRITSKADPAGGFIIRFDGIAPAIAVQQSASQEEI